MDGVDCHKVVDFKQKFQESPIFYHPPPLTCVLSNKATYLQTTVTMCGSKMFIGKHEAKLGIPKRYRRGTTQHNYSSFPYTVTLQVCLNVDRPTLNNFLTKYTCVPFSTINEGGNSSGLLERLSPDKLFTKPRNIRH